VCRHRESQSGAPLTDWPGDGTRVAPASDIVTTPPSIASIGAPQRSAGAASCHRRTILVANTRGNMTDQEES
jgi:hypothetical protein